MGLQFLLRMNWRYGVEEIVHYSDHHMTPRSRGGKDAIDNIKSIVNKVHEAWHHLFGNLLPEEVIAIIEHVWVNSNTGKIRRKYLLGGNRQRDWKIIFGEAGPEEAIEIIKTKFIQREP